MKFPERLLIIPLENLLRRPQARRECRPQAIADLAESIRREGVQVPIQVQPLGDKWLLLDGEHRYLAAKQAGLTCIPALVENSELTDEERLQRQSACNSFRVDFSPIELARIIDRRIRSERLTAKEVGLRIGRSEPMVSKLRLLLLLPEELQQAIHEKRVALSVGAEIASVHDGKERAELSALALKGGLTREKLKALRAARHSSVKRRSTRIGTLTVAATAACTVSFAGAELSVAVVVEALETLRGRISQAGHDIDTPELKRLLSRRSE